MWDKYCTWQLIDSHLELRPQLGVWTLVDRRHPDKVLARHPKLDRAKQSAERVLAKNPEYRVVSDITQKETV